MHRLLRSPPARGWGHLIFFRKSGQSLAGCARQRLGEWRISKPQRARSRWTTTTRQRLGFGGSGRVSNPTPAGHHRHFARYRSQCGQCPKSRHNTDRPQPPRNRARESPASAAVAAPPPTQTYKNAAGWPSARPPPPEARLTHKPLWRCSRMSCASKRLQRADGAQANAKAAR